MARTAGAKKYTKEEVTELLDVVERLKPLGNDMWKNVSYEYNRAARGLKWEERDEESLKAKFKGL